MSKVPPFRLLVVDDNEAWHVGKSVEETSVPPARFAINKEQALAELEKRICHLVSVDQRLPDRPGEGVAADESGLNLAVSIRQVYPLSRVVMLTGHGASSFANQLGRHQIEYFEKTFGEENSTRFGQRNYARLLGVLLRGGKRPFGEDDPGYIVWAFGEGVHHLPPMLADPCGEIHECLLEKNWDKAGQELGVLRERTVRLAWAQACGLGLACGLPHEVFAGDLAATGMRALERDTVAIWQRLDDIGLLGQWKKFVTAQRGDGIWAEAGEAFRMASESIGGRRNKAEHGEAVWTQDWIDKLTPQLIAFIDALAFWAGNPLMTGVVVHPDDRRRIAFDRIAGQGRFRPGDLQTDAQPGGRAADRKSRIHMLLRGQAGDRLIDLYPFLVMKSVDGQPPTPAMLMAPVGRGRPARYVSLRDCRELSELTKEEAQITDEIFGTGWSR
jgi:CheY-like chemotaxis protein